MKRILPEQQQAVTLPVFLIELPHIPVKTTKDKHHFKTGKGPEMCYNLQTGII